MNTKIYFLTITILMIVMGCQNGIMESVGKSDAELIEQIRSASKVDISMNEIPSQSQIFLESDNEYDALGAKKASGLGYEVELAGSGSRFGNRKEFYFNLEGRKLDPYDYGKGKDEWYRDKDDWDREGKEDRKCFDLVLPVTFIMPDGSTVTVASDDEVSWAEIKAWYISNPDADERPALQFPVDISFDEDETMTVNNEEEMRETYASCKSDKDYCGELIYPVTYAMPDGTTIDVASDNEDSWTEIKEWYENNPDFDGEPTIQYPVDVTFRYENSEVSITINSDEEYSDAKVQYCSSDRD